MKKSHSLSRHASGILYLWYTDDHAKRHKISTGCRLKADAKTWVMKFLGGQVQGKSGRKNLSIKEFKDEYLKHSRQHHKLKTYRNCQTCFNEFLKFIDDRPIRNLTVKDIQDFVNHKQSSTSAATARRIYTAMSSAFETARQWQYLDTNVWRAVKKPKLVERTPLWLTVPEFQVLLDAIGVDLQRDQKRIRDGVRLKRHEQEGVQNRLMLNRLILVGFNTGLRSGEIRNLKVSSVDLGRRVLKVRNTDEFTTKTNRERVVPLNDTSFAVLSYLCREAEGSDGLIFPLVHNGRFKVMDESYVGRHFKSWIIKAGLNPRLRFHDLRHSYASNLVASGVPIYAVGKLLGHSDTKTTEIYSHLSVNDLQGTTSNLDLSDVREFNKGEVAGRSKTGVSAEVDALAIQLQVILEKMAAAKASQDG